jgi:cell division protein FtsI (penicillin-binding protein 3)
MKKMSLKKDILWRVAVVYLGMLMFAVVIIGKIIYLQVGEHKVWTEKAEKISLKDITIDPKRGDIYDCKNRLLATSVPYFEVRIDTRAHGLDNATFNNGVDSLALCLSKLFGDKSKSDYKTELFQARKEGLHFYLLKRKVTYQQLQVIKGFPLFRKGRNKGGLIFIEDDRRVLPQVDLANRTIGYTSKSESGNLVGIEGAFDQYLRGVKGIRLMQRAAGNVWIPLNDGNEVEPQDGKDIITTIDVEIQDVAEDALRRQLMLHNAEHGTAVLMEVATGEVKAIANLQRSAGGDYVESFNYAVGESTEPGSTFKLMSLIAAIDEGYVDINDTVDAGNGKVLFYDKVIEDHGEHGLGKISIQRAFECSSNVGVSKVIVHCFKGREQEFIDRLYKMGLNRKMGLDILGEGTPEIKNPQSRLWSGVSLPMMSIGYEVKLTPLQILTFYNAIANNGKMMKPRFVKSVVYHGDVIKEFEPEVLNPSVCSKSTIVKVKKMLEGVVRRGTATNLNNSIYKIAGKTGTAQIANHKFGYKSVSGISYQASFAGYFPAENPKYSCIVVVNAPSNSVYYGNLVAGPVFKEIADKVFATSLDMHREINFKHAIPDTSLPFSKDGYKKDLVKVFEKLDIPFEENSDDMDWSMTKVSNQKVELTAKKINKTIVPNVVNMGAKDAMFLLENAGLEVILKGRGRVKSQSIPAGTRNKLHATIVLEMTYS